MLTSSVGANNCLSKLTEEFNHIWFGWNFILIVKVVKAWVEHPLAPTTGQGPIWSRPQRGPCTTTRPGHLETDHLQVMMDLNTKPVQHSQLFWGRRGTLALTKKFRTQSKKKQQMNKSSLKWATSWRTPPSLPRHFICFPSSPLCQTEPTVTEGFMF